MKSLLSQSSFPREQTERSPAYLTHLEIPNSADLPRFSQKKNEKPPLSSSVLVRFFEGLSACEVVSYINQLHEPQIIVWYVGCYGLKYSSVLFYKESLINPILKINKNASFWLVDLSAWRALKDKNSSIKRFHFCSEIIENASEKQVKCVKSADIFTKMQEIFENQSVTYFTQALKREFINNQSRSFPDTGILVKDLFGSQHSIVSTLNHYDASKAYSPLQYLEGCLLVEEIIKKTLPKPSKECCIVFALPNDELKYYKDSENSFQKDVDFLLSQFYEQQNIAPINVEIHFLAFQYGMHETQRPYNTPGKEVRKHNLKFEDIVGDYKKL